MAAGEGEGGGFFSMWKGIEVMIFSGGRVTGVEGGYLGGAGVGRGLEKELGLE